MAHMLTINNAALSHPRRRDCRVNLLPSHLHQHFSENLAGLSHFLGRSSIRKAAPPPPSSVTACGLELLPRSAEKAAFNSQNVCLGPDVTGCPRMRLNPTSSHKILPPKFFPGL